eukprot:GHVS01029041.1.p1 GENE.GHVS01029041.1~~GHVS01029041.1.p1  ORF type:complete len:209 (-),score=40.51 GHVS01029041.1:104-730(-)
MDLVLGDFTQLATRCFRPSAFDAVFLSPPWGGPGYQRSPVFDVGALGADLEGCELMRLAASRLSANISIYLPRNLSWCGVRLLSSAFADGQASAVVSLPGISKKQRRQRQSLVRRRPVRVCLQRHWALVEGGSDKKERELMAASLYFGEFERSVVYASESCFKCNWQADDEIVSKEELLPAEQEEEEQNTDTQVEGRIKKRQKTEPTT